MFSYIKKILEKMLYVFWPKYMKSGNEHSPLIVMKHWFLQKVLRINASVPWPVHPTSRVTKAENIDRGSRTPGLSMGCHIDGRNGIKFGSNVWIGPHVSIISMNHDVSNFHVYVTEDPITIEKNSWLGACCVVLPGVHLGEHTVVAAGAVVTKSFPGGNQILAGVPAIIVKKLSAYDDSSPENK
jgi:acetyltransferase-like isoleucine patch superfamily enzyme